MIEFIYTVGQLGALNTVQKKEKDKRISKNLRMIFKMNIAEEYYRVNKLKSYPLEFGKCDNEDCIHIPLSAFHQIKKYFLSSVCHVKGKGLDLSLIKVFFREDSKLREDTLQSDAAMNNQEFSGPLCVLIQEEILHMLEDVFVDEQLAKSSPGYVK